MLASPQPDFDTWVPHPWFSMVRLFSCVIWGGHLCRDGFTPPDFFLGLHAAYLAGSLSSLFHVAFVYYASRHPQPAASPIRTIPLHLSSHRLSLCSLYPLW